MCSPLLYIIARSTAKCPDLDRSCPPDRPASRPPSKSLIGPIRCSLARRLLLSASIFSSWGLHFLDSCLSRCSNLCLREAKLEHRSHIPPRPVGAKLAASDRRTVDRDTRNPEQLTLPLRSTATKRLPFGSHQPYPSWRRLRLVPLLAQPSC